MIATFTIAAAEPETGSLAIATASNFLAVGSLVPWVDSGHGLLVSQSFANPAAAQAALKVLAETGDLEQASQRYALSDDIVSQRQFGIMNTEGDALLYSGTDCTAAVESYQEKGMFCLGNMLVPGTIDAMAAGYQQARADGKTLADAMLQALKAAQQAGGDKRGKLAAAMLIKRAGSGYLGSSDTCLDLRVDAAADPIVELEQLYGIFQLYYPHEFPQQWLRCSELSPEQQSILNDLISQLGQQGTAGHDFSSLLAQHNIG
ncbi:MAG: DUF1028 domain-containing protein, partial [Alkalimonas sp.]|nr:DUF1028 domain-containing protein [Alkalimonas sp.]